MKTKEEVLAFILGVQLTTERGDVIDKDKQLQWSVSGGDIRWHIKALWIKGVTRYPLVNPMTDKPDIYHYEDFYFSVSTTDSDQKLCKEICDAIDYINSNEFNED